MFKHYIKIAGRHLWKNKAQHILSILGITTGLICFSISSYYVRQMGEKYSAYPQYKQMARVCINDGKSSYKEHQLTGEEVQKIINNPVAGIDKLAWFNNYNSKIVSFIKGNGQEIMFNCTVAYVNTDFLDVFSCRSVSGDKLTPQPGEVILSGSCARKVYGKENPVGKTLYLAKADHDTSAISYAKIAGVIHDLPERTNEKKDFYFIQNTPYPGRGTEGTALVSKEATSEEVNQRLRIQIPTFGNERNDFPEIQRYSEIPADKETLLAKSIITLTASLILIAALINFLKFSISSFYNRTRELSLRKSLGAGVSGLWSMLFAEICITLVLVTLTTYSCTELFLPVFYSFLPESLFHNIDELKINIPSLFMQQAQYLLALLVICSGIIWIAVQRIRYYSIIKGIQTAGSRKHGIRNTMLGIQIFICIFFIAAAAGMYKAYQQAEQDRFYPISPEACKQIWIVALYQTPFRGHEDEIASRIKGIAGVKEVMFKQQGGSATYITPQQTEINGLLTSTSENYFHFMNLQLEGRFPANENSIVITKAFAKQLAKDSVGSTVTLNSKVYQISGIIEQQPFEQFNRGNQYLKFFALSGPGEQKKHTLYVKCHSGKETEIQQQILNIIRTYLPETLPYKTETLSDDLYRYFGGISLMSNLFILLSVISLIITILGIYSAITMDTESRQKEVAIRKINGAGPQVIACLFGKLYLRLLLITSAVGVPVSFLFLKLSFASFPYLEFLYNPFFWLAILIVVTCIVFITVAYRIWLISRLNPADIIKNE